MPTTILLIRHGETAWNRSGIFRGTHDVPLNDVGRDQANLLAAALRTRQIDAAYTSPLSRARQTAQIVLAEHNIEPAVETGLLDINYGDWTGLRETQVARRWPDQYRLWTNHAHKAQIPAGDTLQAVSDRAFAAMEAIGARHECQTVALFAHRVVNKLLVLAALTLPTERFGFIRQDNCCLNEFDRNENAYVIRTINNTAHIDRSTTDLLAADF